MRTIKVKMGSTKYRLQSDEGTYIGELIIDFYPSQRTCYIDLSKIASEMETLSIGRR